MNESQIQAILMRWVLDYKSHQMATPNITSVYWWECDLLSITRAGYSHEFEIKRTASDYAADFKHKVAKHDRLSNPKTFSSAFQARIPNYFWYVTDAFDVEPPPYAGWIRLDEEIIRNYHVIKTAPRLHTTKLTQRQRDAIHRNVAYKLKKLYVTHYLETV